jgi:hypothetical protein
LALIVLPCATACLISAVNSSAWMYPTITQFCSVTDSICSTARLISHTSVTAIGHNRTVTGVIWTKYVRMLPPSCSRPIRTTSVPISGSITCVSCCEIEARSCSRSPIAYLPDLSSLAIESRPTSGSFLILASSLPWGSPFQLPSPNLYCRPCSYHR